MTSQHGDASQFDAKQRQRAAAIGLRTHPLLLLVGEVGGPQERVHGGAGHPGQRRGGHDGHVAPALLQGAAPLQRRPPLPPPFRLQRLPLRARQEAESGDALGSLFAIPAHFCWHSTMPVKTLDHLATGLNVRLP